MIILLKNKVSSYCILALLFVLFSISSCCTQKESLNDFCSNEMIKMKLYTVVDTAFIDTLLSKATKAHYNLFKCEPKYFDFCIKTNGDIHCIFSSMTYCGYWDYNFFSQSEGFCFYKEKMLFVTKGRTKKYFKEKKEMVYVNFITKPTDVSECNFDSIGNLLNFKNAFVEIN